MALHYKGLQFEIENMMTPMQVKRHNPRGRVPALRIDGELIVDSTDILTELDRRYPDPPLLPTDPVDRAQIKLIEDWADEVLYFYGLFLRWRIPENFERLKREVISKLPFPFNRIAPIIAQRETYKRTVAQGVGVKDEATVRRELAECLAAIAVLVERSTFLVGDRFTRADLSVCACLDQLSLDVLTPTVAAEIRGNPSIMAWMERVHEHVPAAT